MRNSTLKKLESNDYAKVYNELEEFCVKNTNLLLFGEFGNASFPSISDLDVFICLKNQNFLEDHHKIIDFINSDEIRQYLFFHDPLIIPEDILIYFKQFHTAYNLKLSYNKANIIIQDSDPDQQELLNSIWTTFIMGIGPGILIDSNFSVRDKLLVLKNICQSIVNIDSDSDALSVSKKIRIRAINEELSIVEVNEVLKNKLNELYQKSGNLHFESNIEVGKNKYKVERNKVIINDDNNFFSISADKIYIHLNPENFSVFSQFYNKISENVRIQNYIDNAIRINKICNKMNIPYPFITPFGFQFYRNDVKFYIKKKFLAL
jgi:hypothetical protein